MTYYVYVTETRVGSPFFGERLLFGTGFNQTNANKFIIERSIANPSSTLRYHSEKQSNENHRNDGND